MNRRLISVLLALVLATVGTAAVLLYLRAADDRAIEGKKVRNVLVAKKTIPPGISGKALREDDTYWREVRMPAETLPDDALSLDKLGSERDHVITAAVLPGQLLLGAMFGLAVKNGVGLAIPDGEMAVTARVKSTVFSPASVQAGTKVAIFYTYTPVDDANRDWVSGGKAGAGRTKSVTRVLMTDVVVISVGAAAAGDGPTTQAANGGANSTGEFSVTFSLNQEDAERLAHAVALGGELNIAVLGEKSNVKEGDHGIDNSTLFGGS